MQIKKQQIESYVTTAWINIEKGVRQSCILSPCLFNLYAEYILQNARLGDSQARIKIAERNINSLRYADDTSLMAESEEELKNLLMRMKEESENASLKLNIKKQRSWHLVPSLHGKLMRKKWKWWQVLFSGALLWMVTAAMKLKDTCSLEEKLWQS